MLKNSLKRGRTTKILSGGGSRAHKNYTGMYGMQTTQLQHDEGQENSSRQNGNQEVLQIL